MARGKTPVGEDAIRDAIAHAEEYTGDTPGKGGSRNEKLSQKLRNDSGNAERFCGRNGRDFAYVDELGWLFWTGSHWSVSEGLSRARLAAADTARKIFHEVAVLQALEPERAKKLAEWALESGNARRLAGMLSLSEPRLWRRTEELDADPYLLNCQNGTLELPRDPAKPVRLRRHSRRDLITKVLPIGFDPEAGCPQFRAFLDRVLPDRDVQCWLQRFFGYALTGAADEHVFVMMLGDGRNGKGTLIRLMTWLEGDYAVSISFASLAADDRRRGGEASPDVARLAGARLVTAREPKKGVQFDDGRMKELTGEDRQVARHLNRPPFEFTPQFKLMIEANNLPRVNDRSVGFWERLRLVRFDVVIPEGERDPALGAKLKTEGPGVLNWALDGFRLWREGGLPAPAAIRAATQKYREGSDLFGTFLAGATVRNATGSVPTKMLYACYLGFAEHMDMRPMSLTKFGRDLEDRGFTAHQPDQSRRTWRLGLSWRPLDEITWPWDPAAADQ